MQYIIDRFEEEFAVCENQRDGSMQNIRRALFPPEAQEGDAFTLEAGAVALDQAVTAQRRQRVDNAFDALWENGK